jgi:transcriptional regulator with XRE-family HTH domain
LPAQPRQPGKGVPSFGTRLRRIREQKGWSQTELAEKSSLTPAAVSQIEADDRQPSFKTLSSIASALGITVGYLLGEQPELPSELKAFFRDLQKLDANDVQQLKNFAAFLRQKAQTPEG